MVNFFLQLGMRALPCHCASLPGRVGVDEAKKKEKLKGDSSHARVLAMIACSAPKQEVMPTLKASGCHFSWEGTNVANIIVPLHAR